jgi:membrane-associated phospholipid phosphatase
MSRRLREPSSRNRLRTLTVIAAFAACSALALAPGRLALAAEPPVTPPVELRYDPWVDIPITVGLAGALVTAGLLQGPLQPSSCRWCDGPKPTGVNAVDDWFRTALRRSDVTPARVTGDVIAYAAAPLSAAGLTTLAAYADRRTDEVVADVTIIAEGTLSATLVSEMLKPVLSRERPFLHAIADPDLHQATLAANPDALRSFPSGHSTTTFGLAGAAGTVASMRGYRLAPLVWACGLMLGIATAYTRIAADEHYFTDTLGGAAIGLAVGSGVPLLFHGPRARRLSFAVTDVPGGRLASVGGSF